MIGDCRGPQQLWTAELAQCPLARLKPKLKPGTIGQRDPARRPEDVLRKIGRELSIEKVVVLVVSALEPKRCCVRLVRYCKIGRHATCDDAILGKTSSNFVRELAQFSLVPFAHCQRETAVKCHGVRSARNRELCERRLSRLGLSEKTKRAAEFGERPDISR